MVQQIYSLDYDLSLGSASVLGPSTGIKRCAVKVGETNKLNFLDFMQICLYTSRSHLPLLERPAHVFLEKLQTEVYYCMFKPCCYFLFSVTSFKLCFLIFFFFL